MDDVQDIFELKLKIQKLQAWARKAQYRALATERGIAKTAGISRSTLKSSIDAERIADKRQELLANAFGFSRNWHEWRDPEANTSKMRRDTADAFIAKFISHKAAPIHLTVEARPTEKQLDRRFADFSFAPVQLSAALHQPERFALSLSISFDRRGLAVLIEESKEVCVVGLKQVDLQIVHNRPTASITARDIKSSIDGDGNFEGYVEGLAPWWLLRPAKSEELYLKGRRIGNSSQEDCICAGFRAGDRITATMSVRVNDCFISVSDQVIDSADHNRIKLIHQILKIAALNGIESILGEQILTVVDVR